MGGFVLFKFQKAKVFMQIINKPIGELKPYENNPRINDKAVDAVAASIKEFGFKVPIVIDKNVIVAETSIPIGMTAVI